MADGPGIPAATKAANAAHRKANADLDANRRAKSNAPTSAEVVHQGVLDTARREGWNRTPGPRQASDQ